MDGFFSTFYEIWIQILIKIMIRNLKYVLENAINLGVFFFYFTSLASIDSHLYQYSLVSI